MAEEDDSQKTEDPSQQKLTKAKKEGQTATSQEIKSWAVIMSGVFVLLMLAPKLASDVRDIGFKFIQQPHAVPMDAEHLRLTLSDAMYDMVIALTPTFALLVFAAVAASVAQSGFIWAVKKLKFDPSKVSPMKGAKRIVSLRSIVEAVKGMMKLMLVGFIGFSGVLPFLDDLTLFSQYPLQEFLDRLHLLAIVLALATLAVMTVIAVIDYIYQRFAFMKQMRMTKQEVKDEHKQSEGDPHVKARIRSLRMERARQRMMAAVPEADVVVTNPTHFAVALKYSMDDMAAPRLVAKGVDHVAFRIRDMAEEHDVPIVENPPLARALYAAVELDEEIPEEHYKAVAEVIGYVMRLKGGAQYVPGSSGQ